MLLGTKGIARNGAFGRYERGVKVGVPSHRQTVHRQTHAVLDLRPFRSFEVPAGAAVLDLMQITGVLSSKSSGKQCKLSFTETGHPCTNYRAHHSLCSL